MKPARGMQRLDSILIYLTAGLIVLVPFHATLTVWLASNFGHYTLFRLWIEVVIGVLFVKVLYVVAHEKVMLKSSRVRLLWWLSAAYALLHIILGAVALSRHAVNISALSDGLVLNLRPIAIFWLAAILTSRNSWLRGHWHQLLLWPAAIVVAFGLLQHFVLPIDFLRHLGYGPQTILPYETVDQKLAYVRVMSTLRGANPLGAYLVLIIATVTALLVRAKKRSSQVFWAMYVLVTLVVLFFTYSRSAWIGAGLAISCVVWLSIRERKLRQALVVIFVAAGIIGASATVVLRHSSRFDNIFFHTDKTSHSPRSSDQNHASALKSGLRDIAHNPLGRGPGTAGPASVHNNHPARIAENYFIQLGQEVGVFGVGIFILINIILGELLWKRQDPLSRALLAGLLGITLINLFSHAWTDDTLAIVWWALAGVALAKPLIVDK